MLGKVKVKVFLDAITCVEFKECFLIKNLKKTI